MENAVLQREPPPATPAGCHFDAGVRHQSLGEIEAAHDCFRRVLDLSPDCAAAWVNLGLLDEDAGRWAEAVACHERALALQPSLYEAASNLGALLIRLQRFDEAERACLRAIALRPRAATAWSNLGAMLGGLGRLADAEACCRHALALEPGHAAARFNLSYPLLRQGRLEDGLLCMEARATSALLARRLAGPRWDGDSLAGRRLLIVSDGGHGDAIQMARYAARLRAAGAARIVLYLQSALKNLLATGGAFDLVLGCDEALPDEGWDCWAPLMSLPYLCRTSLDTIPAPLPYLRPDPARQAHWRARLAGANGDDSGLRVGLVWRGNPRHDNDGARSLPGLAPLAPLGRLPGVRWFSLQTGAAAADLLAAPAGLRMQSPDTPLVDYAETAAIVAELDLVIGVDTSVVHLAGALGKPVWVLLPAHQTDWRWLDDGRSDSPWYPGVMRLFRQTRAADWAPVVADVAAALEARLGAAAGVSAAS